MNMHVRIGLLLSLTPQLPVLMHSSSVDMINFRHVGFPSCVWVHKHIVHITREVDLGQGEPL